MRLRFRLFAAATTLGAALTAVAATSAAAATGQQLPRLAGIVRDACTGLPIAGATVSLTPTDPAERQPGPNGTNLFGGFLIGNLSPGGYAITISAPGYDTLTLAAATSSDPAVAAGPAPITLDPPPADLPTGEAVNETETVAATLAPANPGLLCGKAPGPQGVPALVGLLRDAATGLPITDAQETLTPTTGEKDPGPTGFSASGLFAWPTLDPGGYTLTLTTPGYKDPGPQGIPVTKAPGPLGFADGSSIDFGTTLDIRLITSG